MNHKKPLISVIMSVYNGERTVPAAIKSIISQTYENLELLIVDDASTDNTFKILKDSETRDKRVKVYQNKNNIGLTKSLNFLINKSQGEFIGKPSKSMAFSWNIQDGTCLGQNGSCKSRWCCSWPDLIENC